MLNKDQYELLQSFVTMPDPTHAEMFALQAEIEELEGEVSDLKDELEEARDELSNANEDKADKDERITTLECALADALSWIAGDSLPSDLAETDKAFGKLYKVL